MSFNVPSDPVRIQTDQMGQMSNLHPERASAKAPGTVAKQPTPGGQASALTQATATTNTPSAEQAHDDAMSCMDEAFQNNWKKVMKSVRKEGKERAPDVRAAQKVAKSKEAKEEAREAKFEQDAARLAAKLSGTTSPGTLKGQLKSLRERAGKAPGLRDSQTQLPVSGRAYKAFVDDLAEDLLSFMATREPNLANRKEVLEFLSKHCYPEDADDPVAEKALQEAMGKAADLLDRRFGKQISRHFHVREEVVKTLGEKKDILSSEKKMRDLLNTLTVEGSNPTDVENVLTRVGILDSGSDPDTLKENRKTMESIKGYFADHVGMTAKTNQLNAENPVLHLTLQFFANFNALVQPAADFDDANKRVCTAAAKVPVGEATKMAEYKKGDATFMKGISDMPDSLQKRVAAAAA